MKETKKIPPKSQETNPQRQPKKPNQPTKPKPNIQPFCYEECLKQMCNHGLLVFLFLEKFGFIPLVWEF